MKSIIRVAILVATTTLSSLASAASTSGTLSFDWSALSITNYLGGAVTTSDSNGTFSASAVTYTPGGTVSDTQYGDKPVTAITGTAYGTSAVGLLSLSATDGQVQLSANIYKTIDLTGTTALYKVTLPYSYTFSASSLLGGSASMNGNLRLEAYSSFTDGSSQLSMQELFSSYGPAVVDSGGNESASRSGVLTLLVGANEYTSRIYINGYAGLNAGADTPISPTPEPETYAMLLAGLGLIGAAVKRRKAKQA